MTPTQYTKWSAEIVEQKDLTIKVAQFHRMCNVFVQDVWLDIREPSTVAVIRIKADIMMELQGKIIQ